MNTSHIIFDLDGTLVNTIEDIALAMNRALTDNGFSALPLRSYPDLVGWGIHRLAELALASQGMSTADANTGDLVNRIAQEALARYREDPLKFSKPYPGIPVLLHYLIERDIVLAVLTNKPDPVARQVVAGLFPHIPFAIIRGDLQGAPKKPDPAVTLSVMKAIGASQEGTLFAGDSVVDVQTARGVGCPVIGVAWGFRGPEELIQAGADYLVQSPDEIRAIV